MVRLFLFCFGHLFRIFLAFVCSKVCMYIICCLKFIGSTYNGTCAIWHLSFQTYWHPTKIYSPKVFLLSLNNTQVHFVLRHPSLVPWCVKIDRFHCIHVCLLRHPSLVPWCLQLDRFDCICLLKLIVLVGCYKSFYSLIIWWIILLW